MKKIITVTELREQLERLEKMGMGNWNLYYRDYDDIDSELTEGVLDCSGEKNIVLG